MGCHAITALSHLSVFRLRSSLRQSRLRALLQPDRRKFRGGDCGIGTDIFRFRLQLPNTPGRIPSLVLTLDNPTHTTYTHPPSPTLRGL
jgi:hypothetical protein